MTQEPQPTPKPNVVKEARQRQLIDATISTIGRVGYSGTTLTHVAGAAGLSPGIVNFYFKTKDQLLAATLAQLAEEHELLWLAKIAAAGGSPEGGLDAMIEADFDPSICTLDKVVVWFAFWAEAQSRPLYRSVVSELEERYFQQTHAFCAELIAQGGYVGIDPGRRRARPQRHQRRAVGRPAGAAGHLRPRSRQAHLPHLPARGISAPLPAHGRTGQRHGAGRTPAIRDSPPSRRRHRRHTGPACRPRCSGGWFRTPRCSRPTWPSAVGVDLPAMLDWIAGRREPSSSQLGRLIGALDPAFLVDVYGDDVEAMRAPLRRCAAPSRARPKRGRAPPSRSCAADRGDFGGDFDATAAGRGRWRRTG